jgi:Uma2 family endonuclease
MHPDLLDLTVTLPGSEELPCSDDTSVDNENQNTLPNWLLAVLEEIWSDRQDWFFGVDMGIYDKEAQLKRTPKVIPDGFLSLGVQRHKRVPYGRLSYVLAEEQQIVPILVLEIVSKTAGKEYDEKLHKYYDLGVKYYVIYNLEYSQRGQHQPFEVYKHGLHSYQLQWGEPYWMPEVGLGIGRVRGQLGGIEREWLAWHNEQGKAYPLPSQLIRAERQRAEQAEQVLLQERQRAEQAEQVLLQERQRAEQAEQVLLQERQRTEQEQLRADRLAQALRELGIDPDCF